MTQLNLQLNSAASTEEKITQVLTCIDYMVDQFIESKNVDVIDLFSVKHLFETVEAGLVVAQEVRDLYLLEYNEFLGLASGNCEPELMEAYEFLSASEKKTMLEIYEEVMKTCEEYGA